MKRLDPLKSKKESVNGTFPLFYFFFFFMYFLVLHKTSLSSLRLFPFLYQISPLVYPYPLFYTLLYILYVPSLLFFSSTFLSSSLILSPYTDAVDPSTTKTPPPVAIPASQPSGSYSFLSTLAQVFCPVEDLEF